MISTILGFFSPARWIVLGLAAVALVGGFAAFVAHQRGIGDLRTAARYEEALRQQAVQAARKYADALIDNAAATQALNDFKNIQEVKDVANQKTSAHQADRLRQLAGAAERLRDPHQTTECRGGGSSASGGAPAAPGDRADDATQATGLLSKELSGLLRKLTIEGDAINDAYTSCRADALKPNR